MKTKSKASAKKAKTAKPAKRKSTGVRYIAQKVKSAGAALEKITAEDPISKSADVIVENIEKLKQLFPEAVTEGKIDFEVLKQVLGGAIDEREEKYGLNWHGKRRARQIALTPSTGTLRPCPEESVDWASTQNLLIEGENLEVLKLLQKTYGGKVKLIYIDPPYNTGNDFVYSDDFQDSLKNYLQLTGQVDGEGLRISSNTQASGRFHTDWLNMMYPRLKAARDLLADDGLIAVSIDDSEFRNVDYVLGEIFGDENHCATIAWQKKDTPSNDAKGISVTHEYLVLYQRSEAFRRNLLPRSDEQLANYKNPDNDPRGPWTRSTLIRREVRQDRLFPVQNPSGRDRCPPPGTSWRVPPETFQALQQEKRIWWGQDADGDLPFQKRFLSEVQDGVVPITWWDYEFAGSNRNAKIEIRNLFDGEVPFDTPKPTRLVRRLLEVAAGEGDLVLDFFAGSGTTGQAVMQANAELGSKLRFVLVQLPELIDGGRYHTVADITKERLRLAAKRIKVEGSMFAGDLGFRVFKLATSNIRAWDPDRTHLDVSLQASIDHLLDNRTEQDILYELLLKLGLDLCVPIETKKIAGKAVHAVGGGVLIACLDESIKADKVEPLALGIAEWHEKLAPAGETTCVFRDSAFADDVAKTNLAAILNQHGLTNVRSL